MAKKSSQNARNAESTTTSSWTAKMSAFGGHPIDLYMPSMRAAAAGEHMPAPVHFDELAISDVEQIVALANREDVSASLAASLHVSPEVLKTYVEDAKAALPPSVLDEMSRPVVEMYPLGAVPPPPSPDAPVPLAAVEPAAAAQAVNLIGSMSPVKNQGARGTCVAFTLTAINEYVRNRQGTPRNLSEQHLYHETKLVDRHPELCGTWQEAAAKVLKSQGQCLDALWPYNPAPPCNNNGVLPADARSEGLKHRLDLVRLSATNVSGIRAALVDNRPVGISIPVFNSWYQSPETRRSGRITMPLTNDKQAGGHALCIVGYQEDATAPGGGFFIVRNHWGTNWGHQNPYGQGYGTLPFQYIASHGWEAFALGHPAATSEEPRGPQEQSERTIKITVRGNVHLIIE